MKKSKEELIEMVGRLNQDVENLSGRDRRIRIEFAKVFGWKEIGGMRFVSEQSAVEPSWEQIFTKVGRLLQNNDAEGFNIRISELERGVDSIRQEINFKETE